MRRATRARRRPRRRPAAPHAQERPHMRKRNSHAMPRMAKARAVAGRAAVQDRQQMLANLMPMAHAMTFCRSISRNAAIAALRTRAHMRTMPRHFSQAFRGPAYRRRPGAPSRDQDKQEAKLRPALLPMHIRRANALIRRHFHSSAARCHAARRPYFAASAPTWSSPMQCGDFRGA